MGSVDISQRFRENTGEINGVRDSTVTGDVNVRQYQISVYALSTGARAQIPTPRPDPDISPYPGAKAFDSDGYSVFFGRDVEIGRVVRGLANRSVTTLHGPAGCGKTSLLHAGVAPAVVYRGGVVITIDDYEDPATALRMGLEEAASDDALSIDLPQQTSLTTLCASLARDGGTVVLMLDQFERFLERPSDARRAFLDDINTLHHGPVDVRLVVAVSQELYPRLEEVRNEIPGVLEDPVEIGLLRLSQATDAITKPLLQLDGPVNFADAAVHERIVADLDELSDVLDSVEPLHLQLVCDHLYNRARDRRSSGQPSLIGWDVYRKGEAAAIVSTWLSDHLARLFPTDPKLPVDVIAAILTDRDGWVTARDLARLSFSPTAVAEALATLAEGGLLRSRVVPETSYGFPSKAARDIALRIANEDTRKRIQANGMLEGKLADWHAREYVVPAGQLKYLAQFDPPLEVDLLQGLLLLRSAVRAGEDTQPWLDALAALGDEAQPLVQLEQSPAPDLDSRVAWLLGIDPDHVGTASDEFGPIAAQAVGADDAEIRETNVLALSLVDRYARRLRAAMAEAGASERAPEVWAALDHAGIDVTAEVQGLEREARRWFAQRRIRHRLRRDRRGNWVTAAGAAGLAGGAVAAYWFFRSLWTLENWGPAIATGWLWGFVLVFALVLSAGLVRSVRAALAAESSGDGLELRRRWIELASAATAFTVADLIVSWGSGYSISQWQAWRLLSLGVGATLWLTLPRPMVVEGRGGRDDESEPTHVWAEAGSAAIGLVVFGGLQLIRSSADGGLLIAISQGGDFLVSQLDFGTSTQLAVADAAILGVMMVTGTRWGVRRSRQVLARWRENDARTGA